MPHAAWLFGLIWEMIPPYMFIHACNIVNKVNRIGRLIPYSGKIWRGINFGGLANLSKGRQIKNSPIFSSCACVSVYIHYVCALT